MRYLLISTWLISTIAMSGLLQTTGFYPVESLYNVSLYYIICSFMCNFTNGHSGWFRILICEYSGSEHGNADASLKYTLDIYLVLELLSLIMFLFLGFSKNSIVLLVMVILTVPLSVWGFLIFHLSKVSLFHGFL